MHIIGIESFPWGNVIQSMGNGEFPIGLMKIPLGNAKEGIGKAA
jgi:hypothetical protein